MKRNNHVNRFCCSMYYPGMQLMKVKEDAAPLTYTGAFDFVSSTIGEPASRQYDYDNDGSLSWDANKGIALITYDRYSMPMSLQFTNGNTTEYVHSATGEKLKAVHRTAVPNISVPVGSTVALDASSTLSVDSTTYAGDFVFENGQLSKYLFDGGYATFANGQPVWHYYYRDHLGNVRAVVSHDGTVEQRNHYYPFGAVYGDVAYNDGLQKYKYNGKELDRMHGLNFYDYGARQYDPLLGMFTQMDPLAEKYYGISPYAYCANNPVNAIDPDGKKKFRVNENGYFYESNTFIEKIKSILGFGSGRDIVFLEGTNNILASYPEGTIKIIQNTQNLTRLEVPDRAYAMDLFGKIMKLSTVEWARAEHNSSYRTSSTLVTEHKNNDVSIVAKLANDYIAQGESVPLIEHSHPAPKGINRATQNLDILLKPSDDDIRTAKKHPNTKFVVYDLYNDKTYYYNGNGIYMQK